MCRVIFSFSTFLLYFAENICFVFKGYNIITIYIIKQDIRIYVVYGRPNSWTNWAEIFDNTYGRPRSVTGYKKFEIFFHGQSAGPIGLTFFVDTHEWPGGVIGLKNRKYFLIFISIFPRATPGPSASR